MSLLSSITSTVLRQAADLKEKIIELEHELAALVGSALAPTPAQKKKSKMSAAGRAKIAAAQKARWAKTKGAKPAVKPAKKRKMSAAGRAAIAAAAKARWAKAKTEGKKSL
jgi:hypothetical protein